MIQGSIRENLDPFKEFDDAEIEKTLEEVKLLHYIQKNCANGLQTEISENNNVFSIG